MKCSYCGAPIEKGRVFCLNCGEEVQWVPEYHPISSYRTNQDTEHSYTVEQDTKPLTQESEKIGKPKKKRTSFFIGCIISVCILLLILGLKVFMEYKNNNSYEYQLSMAETCFSNHEYETALTYIDRAVELMPESETAYLLKAQILVDLDYTTKAIDLLNALIENNGANFAAYELLIRIYEKESNYEAIKPLIVNITDEKIKNHYQQYIPIEVTSSLETGEYQELLTVEFYTDRDEPCTIYYTTDGSDPMLMRNEYTESIPLEEGLTTVRVVAVNEKHIVGETKSYTYEITLPLPEVPAILPLSGEYDTTSKTQITVEVPDGCTAYYSFDEKPDQNSKVYSKPVDMPEGEHTFYVILVNEYGKESHPGSATYVLKEEIS